MKTSATETIFAAWARLPGGWARSVRLTVAAGRFASVEPDQRPGPGDIRVDTALPGLVNAHSHAFQRALVARSEAPAQAAPGEFAGGDDVGSAVRSPRVDSFWSWREAMYDLAARMSPDALRVVARQLYAELLAGGYTSVVEFHYLFAAEPGEPGSRRGARVMMEAVAQAARDVGIRLIWVPVLYAYSGFGDAPPGPGQRPFVLAEDDYVAHLEEAMELEGALCRVGAGVHSLRAASMDMTQRVAAWARGKGRPMHIHIAEQPAEIEACLKATGQRPVSFLLAEARPDASWCLVHATHMDALERDMLAATGAAVCVCPTTEANLGDGLFGLAPWLAARAPLAIGSDSQVGTNAYDELRWLEYGQRLASGTRNVASHAEGQGRGAARCRPTADVLFDAVLRGGHRAAGLGGETERIGLVAGAAADLVAFRDEAARFAGHADASRLSALVFSATPPRADRVMTAGRWVLAEGACPGLAALRLSEFGSMMDSWFQA